MATISPPHAPCLPRRTARTARLLQSAASALLTTTALACAPAGDEAEQASGVDDAALQAGEAAAPVLAQQSASRPLAGPNDSYFAEVSTFGNGCPPGSAATRISADGQVFTTTFSQYEVSVDEGSDVDARECQISIRLHSPGGLSYAVHSFYYQGTSYLEDDVSGMQTANYYFQGAPVTARSLRSALQGPYDADYLFSDEVQTPDEYVWSPCGVDRDLQIVTRLQLQNSTPRRNGYMNLSALDGANRLEFQLAWKPCQPSGAATPPVSTPPPVTPPPQQPPPQQPPPQQPPPQQPPPQQPPQNPGVIGGVVDGLGGVIGGLGDVLGGVLGGLLGN